MTSAFSDDDMSCHWTVKLRSTSILRQPIKCLKSFWKSISIYLQNISSMKLTIHTCFLHCQ